MNWRFYLKEEYKNQLNDDNKTKYIEDAYNYYHKYRHKLFHWDNVELPQDDTLIIENYGEAIFYGEKFVDSSFKYIKVGKKNELRKIALDFIKSNTSILDNSILTSLQVKMINKGIVI